MATFSSSCFFPQVELETLSNLNQVTEYYDLRNPSHDINLSLLNQISKSYERLVYDRLKIIVGDVDLDLIDLSVQFFNVDRSRKVSHLEVDYTIKFNTHPFDDESQLKEFMRESILKSMV